MPSPAWTPTPSRFRSGSSWSLGSPWGFPESVASQCYTYQVTYTGLILPSVIWIGIHLLDKFFDGDGEYLLKDELGDPAFAEHLQEDAAGYLKTATSLAVFSSCWRTRELCSVVAEGLETTRLCCASFGLHFLSGRTSSWSQLVADSSGWNLVANSCLYSCLIEKLI